MRHPALLLLVAGTALKLALAATWALLADEAYYLLWAERLAFFESKR